MQIELTEPRKIANRIVARINNTFAVNYVNVTYVYGEGFYFDGMHPATGKQCTYGTRNVEAAKAAVQDLRTLGYTVNTNF